MSIALIQSKSKRSSLTSDTLAFNSNVTTGSAIIIAVSGNANPSTFSVSDGVNAYSSLSEVDINGSAASTSQIFYCFNATGGAITISVSCTSGQVLGIAIHEFSGLVGLDVHNSGTGNLSSSQSSGNVTTNIATELLFGFTALNYASGTVISMTPEAGWTQAEIHPSSGSTGYLSQYNVVSSTGTYAATSTNTNSKGGGAPTWTCQVATFYGPSDATVSGVGAESTTATGTPILTVKPAPIGASSTVQGTVGTLHTDQHITGVGASSTVSGTCGSLPLKGVGASSTVLAGIGAVTASALVTGVGSASTSAGNFGSIHGTAILSGVGSSTSVVGSYGTITLKPTPAGASATGAASSGTIKLTASVPGPVVTCLGGFGSIITTQHVPGVGRAVTCLAGVGDITCNSAFPMIAFLGM